MGIYAWVFIGAVIYFSPTFRSWLVAGTVGALAAAVFRIALEFMAGSVGQATAASAVVSALTVALLSLVGSAIRWGYARWVAPQPVGD